MWRTDRQRRGDPAPAEPRVGLYFCRCGPNLGSVVRLGELAAEGAWPEAADVASHDLLCSPDGRAWLEARIRDRALERVVVAACSPREHEETFRGVLGAAGRSPSHLQMVNLREQVEWIGGDPAAATARAERLVRAALRRVPLHEPLPRRDVEVSADVLVLGGGPAGVSAALVLAGRNRRVFLAERSRTLGGLANRLDVVFPGEECASCFMAPALERVLASERIEVLTGAEPKRVRGGFGNFQVELAIAPRGVDPAACLGCGACARSCPVEIPDPASGPGATRKAIGLPFPGALPHHSALDRAACLRGRGVPCDACARACAFGAVRLDDGAPAIREVTAGAIVVATGLEPGEVTGPEGVVSSYALERMLHPEGPTRGALRGAGGREPRAVLLGTTAAEEDGDLALGEVLKLARRVRARVPAAQVAILGGLEKVPSVARRAAALVAERIELFPEALRPEAVEACEEGLRVRLEGRTEPVRADLVVVHAAARPAAGADALAALLRLERSSRGFLAAGAATPFEPTATRVAGVHVVGGAAGPRTIAQAIRDGAAAAGLVLASLVPGERRPIEPLAATIDEARCAGCGVCAAVCPFGAANLVAGSRKAQVEAIHCRGCGTCAASCPAGAAAAPHFTRAQIGAELSALLAEDPGAGGRG
jgi:heterodisulfide reductase subunit A2